MSTNLYTNCEIFADGAKLAEAANVKITRSTHANEIFTLARGWAGVSAGAKTMAISVESAVPSADFELDPGKYEKSLQVVELTVLAAGRVLTSKGFIISDSFSAAVNSPSGLQFEFIGEWATWQ